MFTNGMLETDQDVVLIRDIDADVMNSLLDFMYTGQVEITTHNVQSLMQGKIIVHVHVILRGITKFSV